MVVCVVNVNEFLFKFWVLGLWCDIGVKMVVVVELSWNLLIVCGGCRWFVGLLCINVEL